MSRNTSKSTYARVEQRTGPGNEYDWSTDDYEVGLCDSCGITEQYIGRTGRGHGPSQNWIRQHNQRYHLAETQPQLAAAIPNVELAVSLTCGYVYEQISDPQTGLEKMRAQSLKNLGGENGRCGRALRVYDNSWGYDQPLHVCDMGHLNEIPTAFDRRAAGRELTRQLTVIQTRADLTRESFELARQAADLDSRRKQLGDR